MRIMMMLAFLVAACGGGGDGGSDMGGGSGSCGLTSRGTAQEQCTCTKVGGMPMACNALGPNCVASCPAVDSCCFTVSNTNGVTQCICGQPAPQTYAQIVTQNQVN